MNRRDEKPDEAPSDGERSTGTLTLSRVEWFSILVHLHMRLKQMQHDDLDKEPLQLVLIKLGRGRVASLTHEEASVMLRQLRKRHACLEHDMISLEERRLRGGYNGSLDGAWRVLDTETMIIQDVIRRLWDIR